MNFSHNGMKANLTLARQNRFFNFLFKSVGEWGSDMKDTPPKCVPMVIYNAT